MSKNFQFDSTAVITALLVFLCFLAAIDLWRQYVIRGDNYWFEKYVLATKSSEEFWKLGYRMEDLELRVMKEDLHLDEVKSTIDSLAPKLLDIPALRGNHYDFVHSLHTAASLEKLLYNDSSVFQLRCGSDSSSPFLRIGVNDFRTDPRDSCQLFSATSKESSSPLTMFERVPLDENAFALRSVGANNYFIKAVPPPADNPSLPWKLVVGGPSVGANERFRLTEDGLLYSGVMGGFFQCSSSAVEMVKGYAYSYSTYSNKFYFEPVPIETVVRARELVDLSSQIQQIQQSSLSAHKAAFAKQVKSAAAAATSGNNYSTGISTVAPSTRVCIAVPMTSKGTVMSSISDSPFWANLFDSFMKSIDWRSNKIKFRFYLGFDQGDSFYDTGDAWNSFREEFQSRATYRMKEQLMADEDISNVLSKKLSLQLKHFDHLTGAPTQVVSQLILAAYIDGFDYFYQVNDDTQIVSPNWAVKLVETLATNPSIPNFGVTGPTDTNNEKIFTHAFVHRTHIEVFGHMFPTTFRNWWSDDWISTVYGSEHTFRPADVEIKHNVAAQKEHGYTRYEVDQGAQQRLYMELLKGHTQIDTWLKANLQPRLPLPSVCGYSPLVRHLYYSLKSTAEDKLNAIISVDAASASAPSVIPRA